MKEIRAIIDAYSTIDFVATKAALATVVRVEGSSYRRMGARMLVLDNGMYIGGISGGCLEGDALRKAQKAIISRRPSVVTYDTTLDDENQIGVGLGCNGIIDVLFTPLNPDDGNPVKVLASITDTRTPRVLVTITKSSGEDQGRMFLYSHAESFLNDFPIPEIASAVLRDVRTSLENLSSTNAEYETKNGAVILFVECVIPETHLYLFGGNYDVYPIIRIAREIGWEVTVVTSLMKASKELLTLANRVIDQKSYGELAVDPYTAIVLMAHDLKTDQLNFSKLFRSDARYIGLLGPAKRSKKIFEQMASEGKPLREEDRFRIFTPAGLDIGANTPEEIALSIVAEIKSCFAGKEGTSLRLRERAIHDS